MTVTAFTRVWLPPFFFFFFLVLIFFSPPFEHLLSLPYYCYAYYVALVISQWQVYMMSLHAFPFLCHPNQLKHGFDFLLWESYDRLGSANTLANRDPASISHSQLDNNQGTKLFSLTRAKIPMRPTKPLKNVGGCGTLLLSCICCIKVFR